MSNIWDERYSQTEYVYGTEPNEFFAKELSLLKPGRLILPCEGEGRNAVFAAQKGWNVIAFDNSQEGKKKALKLAEQKQVHIDYLIDDADKIELEPNSVDSVALIYAHFTPNIRETIHKKIVSWLKPGGTLILEGFNPNQLTNKSGGPKDIAMLYTEEMLKSDFSDLKIVQLNTLQTNLNEGNFHQGEADLIRLIAVK